MVLLLRKLNHLSTLRVTFFIDISELSWDIFESVDITLKQVSQFLDYYVNDLQKLDKHISISIFPALRKVSISVDLVIDCVIDD